MRRLARSPLARALALGAVAACSHPQATPPAPAPAAGPPAPSADRCEPAPPGAVWDEGRACLALPGAAEACVGPGLVFEVPRPCWGIRQELPEERAQVDLCRAARRTVCTCHTIAKCA